MNYSVAVVINGIDKATAPIRKISRALNSLKQTQSFRQMSDSLNRVQTAMGNVGKEAGLLGVRLGGLALGAGLAFKGLFLDTAVQFEKFQTVLETLEGSSAKAKASMGWISNFAATTPYELDEVTDAFVKLRAYGMKPQTGLLKSLGDASAAMGKPLMQSIEMIADAVTGENERLKEFGIKARAVGSKFVYEYTQNGKTMKKEARKNSREQIQATILSIFNSKYKGAMDKLSRTFGGMVGNISDQWRRLSMTVMGEGLFDFLKDELESFMNYINKLMVDPKFLADLKAFAKELKTLFKDMMVAAKEAWPEILKFGAALKAFTKQVGGMGNMIKIVVALLSLPFVASIISATVLIAGLIASAIGFITSAEGLIGILGVLAAVFELLTNPIAWVVLGVAALIAIGVALQQNWEGVSNWFSAMWQKWGALIRLIFPPIAMLVDLAEVIQQNWGPISDFFTALCSTLQELFTQLGIAIGDVWDGIMDKVNGVAKAMSFLADKLPNVNGITGQQSFAPPSPAGPGGPFAAPKATAFLPGGANLLNPQTNFVPGSKDKLDVAIKVTSEGQASVTSVNKSSSKDKNMNVQIDMGRVVTG